MGVGSFYNNFTSKTEGRRSSSSSMPTSLREINEKIFATAGDPALSVAYIQKVPHQGAGRSCLGMVRGERIDRPAADVVRLRDC